MDHLEESQSGSATFSALRPLMVTLAIREGGREASREDPHQTAWREGLLSIDAGYPFVGGIGCGAFFF